MLDPVPLTAPEAACLEALRSGTERKELIALQAGLNLRQTTRALGRLASLGLAAINDRRTWNLTPRGKKVDIAIVTAMRTRGRKPTTKLVPGASAGRLLALLDQRPRRGAELAALLGVTRQRVHQLVVSLFASGLVRSADPASPAFAIALKNDPTVLLRRDQERVLSAFAGTEATTPSKIGAVVHMVIGKVTIIAQSLRDQGLIERVGLTAYGDLYRLTVAGSAHWQRSAIARRADAPPLPFRSDRVRAVLSCLQNEGPIRTRDVGLGLGIPQPSINALMQYHKRKNAVHTQTDARHAPYELTPNGREMLAAMRARC